MGSVELMSDGTATDFGIGAIVKALIAHRYNIAHEADLQLAIGDVLEGYGFLIQREVELSRGDRIDFMVGSLGIELKVKGAQNAVIRQLQRYAASDRVSALLLVTTRLQLVVGLPDALNGKPLASVAIPSSLR
jgi:hypothetical protein